MNCQLIFYSARKTAFCERSLSRCFSGLNIRLLNVSFAVDSKELGEYVTKAFESCDLVFIVGGFSLDGDKRILNILSNALAKANVDEVKKLYNEDGEDGYVFKSGNQLLIALPDAPYHICEIMQGPVSRYIQITDSVRV